MRINVCAIPEFSQPTVGNVYAIAGGYGRKAGHSMVLLAVTEQGSALMLVIDSGIKTPPKDIELIKSRLKVAEADYKKRRSRK